MGGFPAIVRSSVALLIKTRRQDPRSHSKPTTIPLYKFHKLVPDHRPGHLISVVLYHSVEFVDRRAHRRQKLLSDEFTVNQTLIDRDSQELIHPQDYEDLFLENHIIPDVF